MVSCTYDCHWVKHNCCNCKILYNITNIMFWLLCSSCIFHASFSFHSHSHRNTSDYRWAFTQEIACLLAYRWIFRISCLCQSSYKVFSGEFSSSPVHRLLKGFDDCMTLSVGYLFTLILLQICSLVSWRYWLNNVGQFQHLADLVTRINYHNFYMSDTGTG